MPRVLVSAVFALAVLLVGCAPAQDNLAASATREVPKIPKRVVAAIKGDGQTLSSKANYAGGATVIGIDAVESLLDAGLTHSDAAGELRPQLARAVPTVENGLWVVLPDGRMQTTWSLVPDVSWHDGMPFTSADTLFSAEVLSDRDVPVLRDPTYDAIESLEAPDPATVVVRWSRPFVQADTLFSDPVLPKHLLESAYRADKATVFQGPFWTSEYVGTGPYKLHEFVGGSHVVLDANDRYVLGRPKIDQIEVRFITDASTLVANLLAGSVDLTLGRGLSLEQGIKLQREWRDGTMAPRSTGTVVIYPQFVDPSPAVVADVRFRRALVHAMDRQQMVDELLGGYSSVADSFLTREFPGYPEIEASLSRYAFDPARAAQLTEEVGFRRASGDVLEDAQGRPLTVELRVTGGDDLNQRTTLAITDFWRRAGVEAMPAVIPPQQASDRALAATFPGLTLSRFRNNFDGIEKMLSSNTPLAENAYRVQGNTSRYQSPELDALIERYFVTIPKSERLQVIAGILGHITGQLNQASIFYVTEPAMIGNRLLNVGGAGGGSGRDQVWNVETWDVR